MSISHNKKVYEADVYDFVPDDTDRIINFNRNYHFEEYFLIDSINKFIIDPIKDQITYPLVIVKGDSANDLILARATREQEDEIRKIMGNKIAPYHLPKSKMFEKHDLLFFSLPNNQFLTILFEDGIFAASVDYLQIEHLLINKTQKVENSEAVSENAKHYFKKTAETFPVTMAINKDSSEYVFNFGSTKGTLIFEGKYFGKLATDSVKLSYNEVNHLLRLDNHYTDSIEWEVNDRMKIWINQIKE